MGRARQTHESQLDHTTARFFTAFRNYEASERGIYPLSILRLENMRLESEAARLATTATRTELDDNKRDYYQQ